MYSYNFVYLTDYFLECRGMQKYLMKVFDRPG